MRLILQFLLKILARLTIIKYHPHVVGITGSVGKTSTKEAITFLLKPHFRLRESAKNLNNEIGLPLAILGEADSGYRDPLVWLKIFSRGVVQLFKHNPHYPELLVLEYGIDHPGDMNYLLKIARPEKAIVTAISPTHLEFMGSIMVVAREKGLLVTTLPPIGTAVLNNDDAQVAALASKIKANVLTYGIDKPADVRAESVALSFDSAGEAQGVSFKLVSKGTSIPVLLPGVVGRPPVYVALGAAAMALSYGVLPLTVAQMLSSIPLPPGRLRLLPGIKETTLIDDTYNSSPRALSEALQVLAQMPIKNQGHRLAILGDMLELGKESVELHRQAGRELATLGIDYLLVVGERSRELRHGAVEVGFNPDHAWHFDHAVEAAAFMKDRLQTGDVVLIKGSQGIRCEKITKELMAEPTRAKELLVRQYKPWI